jgi:hypothetical protein
MTSASVPSASMRRVPLGLKARWFTGVAAAGEVNIASPSAILHTRARPSEPIAASRLPSGLT